MNEPDKIYVQPEWITGPDRNYVYDTEPTPDAEEYIRKEALLEWAKEEKLDAMKKKVSSGANKDWTFYDFYKTQIKFWEDIVKHIESL